MNRQISEHEVVIDGNRYRMITEDWQGAVVYETEELEYFVYWPFRGTA